MREYLFRAWEKDMGMSGDFGLGSFPTWGHKSETCPYWAATCRIMQYIGREDCEGKKIFDRDFVKNIATGKIYLVTIDKSMLLLNGVLSGMGDGDYLKVGNIHDNQELLEET